MNFLKKIILLLTILKATFAFSQEVRVEAVLDTSKIRIGEQVKVDLYLTYNADLKNKIKIEWPSFADTITEKIEVVSVSPIDTTLPEKTNSTLIHQHQQITVSIYDSGYYAIPPFKFVVNNDTSHPLYTQPLFIEVHTVPTDSTLAKTKDIKQPFDEPFNWKWYLNYIYGGVGILLALIAIVLLAIYYDRKRRKVIIEPPKPKVPAHITALANLEKIQNEQIWREGKNKEYYSAISDTIRQYIEERFGVFALESTTDEIMKAFRTQVVDKESKERLQQLLTLSDLVKFAKMAPIEDEHQFTLKNSFDFVNGTKREDEVAQEGQLEVEPGQSYTYSSASTITTNKSQQEQIFQKQHTTSIDHSKVEEKTETVGFLKKYKFHLIGIIAFTIAGLVYLFNSSPSPEAQTKVPKNEMEELAYSFNSRCPLMINETTRLDMVNLVDDKTVRLNFSLLNVSATQVDAAALENELRNEAVKNVRVAQEFKAIREKAKSIQFQYYDNNGTELFLITVTPQDYLN